MAPSRQNFITEEQFWSWIQVATPEPYDGGQHIDNIIKLLSSKTSEEILGFDFWQKWFFQLACTRGMRCASHVLMGESPVHKFRWLLFNLIFRGENIFKQAVADPDSLADQWDALTDLDLDDAEDVAQRAYFKATGLSTWHSLLCTFEDPRPAIKSTPTLWDASDLDSMKKITPRLIKCAEKDRARFVKPSRKNFITEGQFWAWIAETSPEPYDGESHVASVTKLLSSKSMEDILGFDFWMDWFSWLSHQGDLWGAAYLLNGGCSDDGFDYWRWGLIFRGEALFKQASNDPDSLAEHWDQLQDLGLEDAGSAACRAFEQKTGQLSREWFRLLRKFKDPHPETPDLTFLWEDNSDDDTWRRLYPRIWFRVTLENVMYQRSRQSEE